MEYKQWQKKILNKNATDNLNCYILDTFNLKFC